VSVVVTLLHTLTIPRLILCVQFAVRRRVLAKPALLPGKLMIL
jgi:hypothetical protein